MLLKNKKTGEIKEVIVGGYPVSGKTKMWECSEMNANEETGYKSLGTYNSLAELNEEWEDYEEPKESEYYWYIGYKNDIRRTKYHHISDFADNQVTATRKEIGNCFKSLEEAEEAVEKLKAWKRLKDKGFRFNNFVRDAIYYEISDKEIEKDAVQKDIELLFFGGKE